MADHPPQSTNAAATARPEFLPPSFDIASAERLIAEHFSEPLAEAYRQLDREGRGMALDFVRNYGLFAEDRPRETLESIAEKIGLAPRGGYLVRTLLAVLSEDGYLERSGEDWIARRPFVEARDAGGPAADPAFEMIRRCRRGLFAFLEGRRLGVEIIFPGERELWARLHHESVFFAPYAELAAHAVGECLPPGGAILEFGAGTGAGTEAVLRRIEACQIGEYAFTDLGETFLHDAERRFRDLDFMRFERFDLNVPSCVEARFERRFDVVYGINVLHVARDLSRAVSSLARFLKPGGRLIVGEGGRPDWSKIWRIDLIFGFLDGWWDVEVDPTFRPEPGFLRSAAWIRLFRHCGLANVGVLGADLGDHDLGGVVMGERPA